MALLTPTWKTSFGVSSKVVLSDKSSRCSFPWECLYFTLIFKRQFARFPFTVAIFPLSTLNVIPLSSACHYSDEKSVANPVGLPCKCKFIFLLLLSIFILECVFCETLCICPTWNLLRLLCLKINVFIRFETFLAII